MQLGKIGFTVALLATLSAGSASAKADVIFSDFGPGGAYDDTTGWLVGWQTYFAPAFSFVSPGDYNVSEIDVALENLSGVDHATVSLWTDVGNFLGTELGSWAVTGQPFWTNMSSPGGITAISNISDITLSSGDTYFLQLSGFANMEDGWEFNSVGYTSNFLQRGALSDWQAIEGVPPPAGAFDVLGVSAPVPEPSSLPMFLAGLAAVGGAIYFRRKKMAALAI